jgi:hypothetical protein
MATATTPGRPPFSAVHPRGRDSEGAPRRRWLEYSRSRKSSSCLRDRFTMKEPLGVHQWAKRNHCFPPSQVGERTRLLGKSIESRLSIAFGSNQ